MSRLVRLVYDTIKNNPGLTIQELGELLGLDYSIVESAVCDTEKENLLLEEDDGGRITVFGGGHETLL